MRFGYREMLALSKISCMVACTFAAISIGTFMADSTVILDHANHSLASVDTVSDNLNRTLDEINRPCGNGKPCGTLATFDKTLGTARGTMGQVEIAAIHENTQLGTIDLQERELYSDLHTTLTAGQKTLNAGTDTLVATQKQVEAVQPVLDETTKAAIQLQRALGDADKVVTDPNIARTLSSVQQASEAANGTLNNLQDTSNDVRLSVHSFFHPQWFHKLIHGHNPF